MKLKKPLSITFIFSVAIACVAWLGFQQTVNAHGFKLGDLGIEHPYANPTPVGSKNGSAYFKAINNGGKAADRLMSAQTSIANSTELHTMKMDGNIMRMREVVSIELPANGRTLFGQGTENGYHIMLMGLKEPLKDGDSFKLNLKFEKAGEIEVVVQVEKSKGSSDAHKHH